MSDSKKNDELLRKHADLVSFSKNGISLDVKKCLPGDIPQLIDGTPMVFLENGKNELYTLARKKSSPEIMESEMSQILLDNAVKLALNPGSEASVLQEMEDSINKSIQDNTVIFPVSGIEVEVPFQIGKFTLQSKDDFISKLDSSQSDIFRKNLNSGFGCTIAIGCVRCSLKSAKEIARKQLLFELTRFKAFLPFYSKSTKHWILPVSTDIPLVDSCLTYGSCGCCSNMSVVANIKPFVVSNERIDSLNDSFNFNQIVQNDQGIWDRISIAYEWLGKEYDEENLENKLVYSIFALECLLSYATENFSSITAAVSEKCAYLLGGSSEEKRENFKLAKKMYTIRSALVHSSDKKSVNAENVWVAFEMAIAVLKKVVELTLSEDFKKIEDLDNFILKEKFK